MERVGACKRRKTEDDGWNKDILGKKQSGWRLGFRAKTEEYQWEEDTRLFRESLRRG